MITPEIEAPYPTSSEVNQLTVAVDNQATDQHRPSGSRVSAAGRSFHQSTLGAPDPLALLPLLGGADPSNATRLMGPSDPDSITSIFGLGDPPRNVHLLGLADLPTGRSVMGPGGP